MVVLSNLFSLSFFFVPSFFFSFLSRIKRIAMMDVSSNFGSKKISYTSKTCVFWITFDILPSTFSLFIRATKWKDKVDTVSDNAKANGTIVNCYPWPRADEETYWPSDQASLLNSAMCSTATKRFRSIS